MRFVVGWDLSLSRIVKFGWAKSPPYVGRFSPEYCLMKLGYLSLILTAFLLLAGEAESQEPSNAEASQTRFTISQDDKGLTINFDGKLFAKYDLHSANKPYLCLLYTSPSPRDRG